jgi:hypothetical protein
MRWDAQNSATAQMPTLQLRLKLPPLLLLIFLTGCSYLRHDRGSLDKFGSAYVGFREAASDSEIVSWVIVLDQSERSDGSNGTSYRRYFVGALDVKAGSRVRTDSARQAVAYYNSNSTKAMDDLESRNDAAHEKFIALVEAANGIRVENYRRQALAVVESARKVDNDLEAMRRNYANLYDIQVAFLKRIDEEKGDLNRALPAMKEKIPEKERLASEGTRLRNDEQAQVRRLQEAYAAFKGSAGMMIDYVEPREAVTDSGPPQSSSHE